MTKDIATRNDVELLVNAFYAKVIADKELGHIFQEIAKVNWTTHLSTMYDFWENIILFTGSYEGNPMNLHQHLHHIAPLNETHFEQWNSLFIKTVDELFEGTKASLAKQRALSISLIIKKKLLAYQREHQG
jgi:hemoglobin